MSLPPAPPSSPGRPGKVGRPPARLAVDETVPSAHVSLWRRAPEGASG